METIEGKGARAEGTQGQIPPPPGSEAGRQGPPAPPGYYPPYGGWYYPPPAHEPSPQPRRSSKPKIVGILLIFSGVLSMIMGGIFGAMMYNMVPWMNEMQQSANGYGEIDGQIFYMNSTPAAGVNVTVVDLDLTATTNEMGTYRILNVNNGWHDLKVESAGFRTLIKSVYVTIITDSGTSGAPVVADFQLQPGTGEQRLGGAHTPGSKTSPIDNQTESILRSMGAICAVAGILLGALTVLGGYFAMRTEKLAIVALGTLCGILSFGFAIGSGLSLIALILLLLSTDEFDRAKKERAAKEC